MNEPVPWSRPKHIVVTGDVVCDFYVVRPPRAPAGYREPLEYANMKLRLGGAWYLKRLVDLACSDLIEGAKNREPNGALLDDPANLPLPGIEIHEPERDGAICMPDDESLAHAFSIVAHHERQSANDDDDKVWRITEFLGCRTPDRKLFGERSEHLYKKTVNLEDAAKPDVLVIDDQNLGFRSIVEGRKTSDGESKDDPYVGPKSWRDILPLEEGQDDPPRIILKTGGPLAPNPLLSWLIDNFADQLTIVVSVHSLRERGASIPDGLSWDSSLEGLNDELRTGRSADDIAKARHLLVYFGSAGVASYRRERAKDQLMKYHRLVFHPSSLEGEWSRTRPGTMFGSTSILTASIVRYALDCIFNEEARRDERFKYKNECRACNPGLPTDDGDSESQPEQEFKVADGTKTIQNTPFENSRYPLYIALSRALAAIRTHIDEGLGKVDENSRRSPIVFKEETGQEKTGKEKTGEEKTEDQPNPTETTFGEELVREILHPPESSADNKRPPGRKNPSSENDFRSTFRLDQLSKHSRPDETVHDPLPGKHNLVMEATGHSAVEIRSKALEIAYYGRDRALHGVPKAEYGNYFTVDRDEVEHINGIRSLILGYINNPKDEKPLSIAVFGPPGSGKSFAVKQLLSSIFPDAAKPLEFNLSQIRESSEDLHRSFHQVRDRSIRGEIPLVFWDEFDASEGPNTELHWLKHFLAPMQDAEFREHGVVHAFGKAIFIFAGGTSESYRDFDATLAVPKRRKQIPERISEIDDELNALERETEKSSGDDVSELKRTSEERKAELSALSDEAKGLNRRLENFKSVKGPDFVSRLRGYLDIKGPNECGDDDPAYLVRRALLLRSSIERNYPELIDRDSKRANVDFRIVSAFLRSESYLHGSRSLDATVKMSALEGLTYFGPSHLPHEELRILHVSTDFSQWLQSGPSDEEAVEILAEALHKIWKKEMEGRSYEPGEERNDNAPNKTHPLLKDYSKLKEKDKDGNRWPARILLVHLAKLGFTLKRREDTTGTLGIDPLEPHHDELRLVAHDIWMRDHLIQGYEHGCKNLDGKKLHMDMVPFEQMTEKEKQKDTNIAQGIAEALWEGGFELVKKDEDA